MNEMKIDFTNTSDVHVEIHDLQSGKNVPKKSKIHLYKILQSVKVACDKNLQELVKLQSKFEILQKVDVLRTLKDDLTQLKTIDSKKKIKQKVISSLLDVCYVECLEDTRELVFFAAAKFDIPKLIEITKQLSQEELDQVRCSDSVIAFTLKFGNISNTNLFECIKILVETGVDVNRADATGKFPIDYVATAYGQFANEASVRENLKKAAQLFLDKKISVVDEVVTQDFLESVLKVDLNSYKFASLDVKIKLFYWISKSKLDEFTSFKKIGNFVDCDNGESTLLQFAVNKSQNMLPIVQSLLKNGSDPNKTTKVNTFTPLEIAARNNYEDIFRGILSCRRTQISEENFCNFVRWRGYSMKRTFFALLLESDKLNPSFVYSRTGNTPLHYAIRLSHKNAIQKLLKRSDVSLTVENKAGKCPLDILNPLDLGTYFDSCIVFDNRKCIDFNSTEYKMQFRFKRLTDGDTTEVDVISLIGKLKHLEHLLSHPLIHSFVMLKWFKVQSYFWVIVLLQASIFLSLSVLFYRYPFASPSEHIFCFCLYLLNVILKFFVVFNTFKITRKFAFKKATLHGIGELFFVLIALSSFFLRECRAFIFIHMAILFLLTTGYHPKLSHWSIMLQKVFKTFTILLVFFSLFMIAFAAGFHIMFEGHRFFSLLDRSVFMSYFMTIGEINVGEVDFEATPLGGYLLFFFFAMSMSVVIINFWTGIAIRDIDHFEKKSEVNALKNVIAFIEFIEKLYRRSGRCKKFLPHPLLFAEEHDNYDVDFYPNKDDQFELKYFKKEEEEFKVERKGYKRRFPKTLDPICFQKIRLYYYKQQNTTNEQKILAKLEKVIQILEVKFEDQRKSFKRTKSIF